MWKKFKWDMFVTSFIPLWLSIIVIDVWTIVLFIIENWNGQGKPSDNLMNVLCRNHIQLVSIAVISVLVLVSIIGINSFLKKLIQDKKHLPKGKIEKATKANKLSSEFLLAYILPMIAFDFGNTQNIVLFIIYFSVLAYLCIRNNNIYTNILLEIKGYRIYTCDLTCKVLGDHNTYHDSIVISKSDLTQEEGNDVPYWDFENYIYITADREDKK
ncbi:hypothetical protein [Zhenpiania hominis]|uniref:hypothetical protein n=1 Tax=Zhenpiania hominis TaxID=2763644 RepID=UPI0039F62097